MSESKSTGGAHILVYPFPASGHVIPILDFTRQLLARGLTVTLAINQKNLPLLEPFLHRVRHLVLPDPTPETLPPSKIGLISYIRFFRDTHYPILLDWFHSHQSPPVAIVSDFLLGWTHDLASQVGARSIVFSPSSALTFSVMIANWRHLPRNDDDDPDFLVSHPEIPNCPKEPWWQISRIHKMGKEDDDDPADLEFIKNCFLTNLMSWGIVFNSFAELERVFLDHMKREYGNDNVWAAGPLLPSDRDLRGTIDRGGPSSLPCHEVLTWLDSCEREHSVVYVCFGSRTVLRCQQMNALAAGLEKSGVHFVFCYRNLEDGHQPNDLGLLPEGFEDRVAGRGFVVRGWAPQMAILRHRAVGAFLTHCGWNSVLEGISAGVVMLTWPMAVDQFLNAQFLVDELGVGIPVGEATQKIPNSDELSRVLRESVQGSRPERVKVKKMQEAAALSAVQGGSSNKELEEFVKSVNALLIKVKTCS